MKEKKIIHIHSCDSESGPYFPPRDSDYYYLVGWASIISRHTMKYGPDFALEIWRLEKEVSTLEKKVVSGITCRLFPKRKPYIFSFLVMLFYLGKETRNNNCIINIHELHNLLSYILIFLFRKIPLVYHHHGECPPLARKVFKPHRYGETFPPLRVCTMRMKAFLKSLIEKKLSLFKHLDYISVIAAEEGKYLSQYANCKVVVEQARVDFDTWRPVEKTQARRQIGVPENAKIILSIESRQIVKDKKYLPATCKHLRNGGMKDLMLVMIGIFKEAELEEFKDKDIRVFNEYIEHEKLVYFYSAADLYVMNIFGYNEVIMYSGFSTSCIEACACNTPIVSTQLREFPETERDKIGLVPSSPDDLARCIKYIFENYDNYQNVREVARKYYNEPDLTKRLIGEYKTLFKKYFDI